MQQAIASWKNENSNWVASDSKLPRPEWWNAVDAICDAICSAESVPGNLHAPATALLMQSVADTWRFGQFDPSNTPLLECLGALIDAPPRSMKATESWEELLEMPGKLGQPPIPDSQVATMKFGSHEGDSNHQDNITRVNKAKLALSQRSHGQKFDAEALREPVDVLRVEQADEWAREKAELESTKTFYVEQKAALRAEADAAATAEEWQAPPESIEELIMQGVAPEQISRMHRVDLAHIQDLIRGQTPAESDAGPVPAEAQAAAYASLSPEDQVALAHQSSPGASDTELVAVIKAGGGDISRQKVTAIRATYAQEAASS